MSLEDWKRAGAGTLRALNALREFNARHAKPRVVERWVAWHPDNVECYAGTTAEEAWMHLMQYENRDRAVLLKDGWRVSLVQNATEPKP